MSGDPVLRDTARRLFAAAGAEDAGDERLWANCTELGWNLVGVAEERGGVGGTLHDLATLVREAGRGAARVPLLEDATARACLGAGGLLGGALDEGVVALDTRGVTTRDGRLAGSLSGVPWASAARFLVVASASPEAHWTLVDLGDDRVSVVGGRNLAGEPRDTVVFDGYDPAATWTSADVSVESVRRRVGLLRGVQLLGTLESIMELSVEHAANREQFGKPINRYQAVAQHLAVLRCDLELATVVVETALDAGIDDDAAIAVMRATLGVVSEEMTARAHQVHAAIGVTREHPLHRSTLRAWAYRDEDGTQREWTLRLGRAVVDGGPDALWEMTSPRSG